MADDDMRIPMKKIAITGPESTGKSKLAEQLAEHYDSGWVPEYARTYLENLGKPYNEEDILQIARGQVAREQAQLNSRKKFLFCDTELLVTRIWSIVKYNRCHPWIEETFQNHHYDLFLLCDIDIPWEYDPLREHPEMRRFLFDFYYRELIKAHFPFRIISGLGPARLQNAIKIIDNYNF